MDIWQEFRAVVVILFLSWLGLGCQPPIPRAVGPTLELQSETLRVPDDIRYLAVLYPNSSSPEFQEAYARLASAAFRLKVQRPMLKIVDRFDMATLLAEQRFQLEPGASEATAVRLGRLLGVDSVLFYRIHGPTWRDRVLAKWSGSLPPIVITSKIIRVESAEVVFHNVATARFHGSPRDGWGLGDAPDPWLSSRDVIEQGIVETVLQLHRAFQ